MMGYQLGVGMSARSQLGHTIYRNNDRLDPYVARIDAGQSPVEQIFPMGVADRKTQFIVRSLGDGVALDRGRYRSTFGNSVEEDFGEVIEGLSRAGVLADEGTQLRLSETGKLLHDLITLAFYPAHAREWLAEREDQAALVQTR
jgi:oxygen-independent coproporphyrinogen-3 oxidase